jgi:Leucine-rich repeat (LRR) protein
MKWPTPVVLLSVALVGASACSQRNPNALPPDAPNTNGGPKQPDAQIDPATVEAWKQAGFTLESAGSSEKGEQPWFKATQPITDDTLTQLPKPTVPFGLNMADFHPTDVGLKYLLDIDTLTILHIQITDSDLERFAAAGLHKLALANLTGNKRPTKPEDITELYLAYTSVTDEGLKHLAGLKNLSKLDLAGTEVTGAGLKHLTNLRELGLQHTKMTDAGLETIAGIKSLTTLNLEFVQVTDAGIKHLAGLPNLTDLNLVNTQVTDAGLVPLAGVTTLTSLALPRGVTDGGLKRLAPLKNLTTLDLSTTQVKGYDLKSLSGLKHITTLGLNLRETGLRSVAAVGLLHAIPQASAADGKRPTGPEDVVALDLHDVWMFDSDLAVVAPFKHLTSLDLSGTKVTGTGLKDLAGLKKLTELKLSRSAATDEGLEQLVRFDNLASLDLTFSKVTQEGAKKLQKALPKCHINW